MSVFVDTSALMALVNRSDSAAMRVATTFESLAGETLITHNYVVIEATTLVDRRLGRSFARRLATDILAPLDVFWVDETTHGAAASAYLGSRASGPSLVDFTSFEVMRKLGIRTALAVDRDFADAGFDVIPA